MRLATGHLTQEHEKILSMLKVMERICSLLKKRCEVPPEHFEDMLQFFEIFADKIHHGKEEEVLLPALLEKGFPLPGGPLCTYFKGLQMMRPSLQEQIQEIEGFIKKEKGEMTHFPESNLSTLEGTIPVLVEHQLGRRFVQAMRLEIGKNEFISLAYQFIHFLREHIDKEDRCLFPMTHDCLNEERQKKMTLEFERIDQQISGSEEFNILANKWERLKEIYLTSPILGHPRSGR